MQDFCGHIHELVFDFAGQHHGPFGQARHFVQQALILDGFEAMHEGLALGVFADDLLAARGVDQNVGVVQLLLVILEATHFDGAFAQEAVAARDIAALHARKGERHHFAIQRTHDPVQRAHPADCAAGKAHGFRPWQFGKRFRQNFRQHFRRIAALARDHGDIEFAFAITALLALLKRYAR